MSNPDDRKDDTGDIDGFAEHQRKANAHQNGHRGEDGQLRFHKHPTLLYIGLQMLLIKIGSYEPIMQPLGGISKEEYRG